MKNENKILKLYLKENYQVLFKNYWI